MSDPNLIPQVEIPTSPMIPLPLNPLALCRSCSYRGDITGNPLQVFCRRFPPSVFVTGTNRDEGGNIINHSTTSIFPVMSVAGVCGEWKGSEIPA